jgi:hypothetical protein
MKKYAVLHNENMFLSDRNNKKNERVIIIKFVSAKKILSGKPTTTYTKKIKNGNKIKEKIKLVIL